MCFLRNFIRLGRKSEHKWGVLAKYSPLQIWKNGYIQILTNFLFVLMIEKVTLNILLAILYKLFYKQTHLKKRKADPSSRVDDCAQPLSGTAHEQTAGLRALDEALQQRWL